MQRKILDVWPRLLRPTQSQGTQIEETDLESERGDDDSEDEDQQQEKFNEEELLQQYKNLYWTRLIKVEHSVADAAH